MKKEPGYGDHAPMVIFLCIVIVHTAGIAKGFGWENDLFPLHRYRYCLSSRKELRMMIP